MNQFARPGLAVTELPSFNENDKGKVLTINSESGVLGWEEGSGGGSSGGGALVVNISEKTDSKSGDTKGIVTTPYVCDKTAGEMWSALTNGNGLLFYNATNSGFYTLKYAVVEDGTYGFAVVTSGASMTFISESADAYPETAS